MSKITVGDIIPLAINLHDNSPDKKIRAEIFSIYGDSLNTVYLFHFKSGLYVNNEILMPDLPYVIAKYDVENSDDYESSAEIFYSCKKEAEPESFISGQVESVVKSHEFITGVITDEIKIN